MRACIAFSLVAFVVGFTLAAALGSTGSAPASVGTVVLIEERANVIRFLIDGDEKARLDQAGLHVRGDLNYSGTITDVGQVGPEIRTRPREYKGASAGDRDAQ